MNLEIERKFLVKKLNFKDLVNRTHIKQYYISINKKMVQRLRFFDDEKAIISYKAVQKIYPALKSAKEMIIMIQNLINKETI